MNGNPCTWTIVIPATCCGYEKMPVDIAARDVDAAIQEYEGGVVIKERSRFMCDTNRVLCALYPQYSDLFRRREPHIYVFREFLERFFRDESMWIYRAECACNKWVDIRASSHALVVTVRLHRDITLVYEFPRSTESPLISTVTMEMSTRANHDESTFFEWKDPRRTEQLMHDALPVRLGEMLGKNWWIGGWEFKHLLTKRRTRIIHHLLLV